MILKNARVRMFRNIIDSTEVKIEDIDADSKRIIECRLEGNGEVRIFGDFWFGATRIIADANQSSIDGHGFKGVQMNVTAGQAAMLLE